MLNNKKAIFHDKNGRKIYPDSLLYDEVANEYFFLIEKMVFGVMTF
ncbi:hypothetical protein AB6A19_04880 [Lactobacillus crispatus]